MKTLALSIVACALIGCVGIPVYPNGTPKPTAIMDTVTNTVPEVVEIKIEEVEIVTTPTGLVTNITTRTEYKTNYVEKISYAPKPALVDGIQTARDVSGWLPEPIGSASNIILGLLSLGLTGYASYMSKRAALLNPVIAGVEKRGDTETKKEIQALAIASGLEAGLNAIVNKVTKKRV